jgi:ATP-dependent RNA circularization protein (DNA/RNA ligase family)
LSKNKLHKYPKIWHLPWSRSWDTHDRVFTEEDVDKLFVGKAVTITEKLDGENTNMYNDYIHARSLDSGHHVSRSWVKQLHANIKHDIPDNWRICGENVYAKHSILYHDLPTAFFVFGVYDENNNCLSWEDTKYFAKDLGLACVPVLEDNKLFQRSIHEEVYTGKSAFNRSEQEGYVVRLSGQISWAQHNISYAKFVRPNHVRTTKNWMTQLIIRNEGNFNEKTPK